MGLFSFLKKDQPKEESKDFTTIYKKHLVDDFFWISLPVEWVPFESDRFRAKTSDGKVQISIINYQMEAGGIMVNGQFFKDLKLNVFDTFVKEGGYEPYDDLLVTENFIYKSFKVNEETQYYLTTARKVNNKLIVTDIILRDLGGPDYKIPVILQTICKTMALK